MTVKLYTREPTYTVKIFDLGVARTNELVTFNGQLIIVKEITGDATIKFNNVANDEIPLTEMRGKTSIVYNRFYITNVAQAGKTLRLLAGRDMDFESGNDVSIVDTQENRINPATSENQILVNAQKHGQIDVLSSALPVGAATEATVGTILKTSDLNIETATKNLRVDVQSSTLPTGAATSENQILLTEQIILMPVSTHTTSWASEAIPVSRYNKGNVIAHITAFKNTVGDERLILSMETSIDGIRWKHVATFIDEETMGNVVSITGDPDRHKIKRIGDFLIQFNDCIMKFIRINGILEGTSPNITIEVIGALK